MQNKQIQTNMLKNTHICIYILYTYIYTDMQKYPKYAETHKNKQIYTNMYIIFTKVYKTK